MDVEREQDGPIFPSGEVPQRSEGEGGERSELTSALRAPAPPTASPPPPQGEDKPI